jgi:hypothetical protein
MHALQLAEREVSRQISDYLGWHGWRRIRNQSGVATNAGGGTFRFGEKGIPDLLFLRYIPEHPGIALVLWVETKRAKGKLAPEQLKWQHDERLRGALVANAFSLETFSEWYQETLGWIHTADGPPIPGNLHLF